MYLKPDWFIHAYKLLGFALLLNVTQQSKAVREIIAARLAGSKKKFEHSPTALRLVGGVLLLVCFMILLLLREPFLVMRDKGDYAAPETEKSLMAQSRGSGCVEQNEVKMRRAMSYIHMSTRSCMHIPLFAHNYFHLFILISKYRHILMH